MVNLVWPGQGFSMPVVDILEAKSTLSRLVKAIETGAETETEIVIARDGRPAARLVAIEPASTGKRIGAAKGRFVLPDDIDTENTRIEAVFAGTPR